MNLALQTLLENIANQLEQFINWTGRMISWLVLVMVLVMFGVVILRYVFDSGSIALQESISYLHATVFLIGAAYTLQQDAHVRVDIFYSRLTTTGKAWVDLLGHIFLLMPVMIFIFWVSWPYVVNAWEVNESSRQAGGLPGIYLVKSLILIMAALVIVQASALGMRAIIQITRGKTA